MVTRASEAGDWGRAGACEPDSEDDDTYTPEGPGGRACERPILVETGYRGVQAALPLPPRGLTRVRPREKPLGRAATVTGGTNLTAKNTICSHSASIRPLFLQCVCFEVHNLHRPSATKPLFE